jgi:Fe-S-cluster containining protein
MSDESSQIAESPLPPLYARWMKDLLSGDIPAETAALCLNCVMCPYPDRLLTPDDITFDEQMKCCTYIPRLPNFLVGCILAHDSTVLEAGKSSIEARLQRGIGVGPLGLERTAEERLRFEEMIKAERFGKDPSFRCPHFLEQETGICVIWPYRNAACATYFCRHVRGAFGAKFWNTLKLLLTAAENAAAQWCVHRLDLDYEALFDLYATRILGAISPEDQTADESMRRRLWGSWWGREREFYVECGRLAVDLTWGDVIEIGGIELRNLAGLAEHAYRQLMEPAVPATLRFGDFSAVALDAFSVRVWGSCRYQPIDLSSQFVQAPLSVEEGPAAEVLANIQAQTGLRITPALLRQLLDLGILSPGLESDEPKSGNTRGGL